MDALGSVLAAMMLTCFIIISCRRQEDEKRRELEYQSRAGESVPQRQNSISAE